jgi:hypothetical protein
MHQAEQSGREKSGENERCVVLLASKRKWFKCRLLIEGQRCMFVG